jgi:hypothetical protein
MTNSTKPSLLGTGGKRQVSCVCSFCANLFKGYARWAEKGYQDCPACKLSGTGIVKIISQEQLKKLLV